MLLRYDKKENVFLKVATSLGFLFSAFKKDILGMTTRKSYCILKEKKNKCALEDLSFISFMHLSRKKNIFLPLTTTRSMRNRKQRKTDYVVNTVLCVKVKQVVCGKKRFFLFFFCALWSKDF